MVVGSVVVVAGAAVDAAVVAEAIRRSGFPATVDQRVHPNRVDPRKLTAATHLVAVYDGRCPNTKQLILHANHTDKKIYVFSLKKASARVTPSTPVAPAPKRGTTTTARRQAQPAPHVKPSPLGSYYESQMDTERATWLDPRPEPPADWSGDFACPVCARSTFDVITSGIEDVIVKNRVTPQFVTTKDLLRIEPYDIKDQAGVCRNEHCPHEGQPLVRVDVLQRGRTAKQLLPLYRQAAQARAHISKALRPIEDALNEAKLATDEHPYGDTVAVSVIDQLDELLSWLDAQDVDPIGSKPEQLARQHLSYVYQQSRDRVTELRHRIIRSNMQQARRITNSVHNKLITYGKATPVSLKDRIIQSRPQPRPEPAPYWITEKTAFHKRKPSNKKAVIVADTVAMPVSGGSGKGRVVMQRSVPVRSLRQRRKDEQFGSARWFARHPEQVVTYVAKPTVVDAFRSLPLVERGERVHAERVWLKRSWAERKLGYKTTRWG